MKPKVKSETDEGHGQKTKGTDYSHQLRGKQHIKMKVSFNLDL